MSRLGPLERYKEKLAEGELHPDSGQEAAIQKLQDLHEAIAGYKLGGGGGLLSRFGFGEPKEPPRGLYIHGSVGRGKSMLMDLFFDGAQVERKRRVHFHEFMQEAHGLIHTWRQENKVTKTAEPIRPTARTLADRAWLLCFDEFEVRDIADAMIVSRLFYAMFELGVVVVATSNRRPDDLYKDGLQRDLFLPFIDILKQRLDVHLLTDGKDHRLDRLKSMQVFHVPAGEAADGALDQAFADLTDDAPAGPEVIPHKGREIPVPLAAGVVGRFTFHDLCEQPFAAGDFLAIARRFKTVFVSDIPVMTDGHRDAARRFMLLIDTLYDQHVNIVASASAVPEKLYAGDDWGFEFDRTVSRLMEMQSTDYIERSRAL